MMDPLILQLADSAFPTGGFAHSGGLEALVNAGEIPDEEALRRFLRDALAQAANGACPFVDATGDVRAIDARCDLFLANDVANRASRTQGRAFLDTASRIFPHSEIADLRENLRGSPRHHAPVFGAVARALGLERPSQLFLHVTLRSLASAAVRLGVIGPHRAQRIMFDLGPSLPQMVIPPLAKAAWTSPIHELFQGTHDRLYARLFQS
ncbi:MAG: urease accessory protein UreF [Polyangiales bacterium]